MKTSEMKFNKTMVKERRSKELKELDEEFNTDGDIAKGHKTFKSKEERENEDYKFKEVPHPMLRDGCSLEEFKSFILLWRLYAECHDGKDDRELQQQLLRCLDGPLEAALYDAIGYHNINTIPEADILEELGKLAVEENLAMGVIIDVVDNYPTVISEENPVNQQTVQSSQVTDHRSPAHRNTAHSSQDKQPPAKFKPPDHAQAVVTLGLPREDKHGHAAGGGAEKVGLYKIPARRPAQTWHQKTSTELAQEAFQTEKKPPDITMIGLSGGREPDLQVGGHHHGLQVNHPLADRSWRNLGGPVEVLINLFSQKTENL